MASADSAYRDLIDALVKACREGQGTIAARRARSGVWNAVAEANPAQLPEQHNYNVLLSRMTPEDREVLAQMLAHEFQRGAHTALVLLHESGIPPFDAGYEGAPVHDFMARLDGRDWPKRPRGGR